jgi:4-hydroxy-2-oxoheptanedioate aldolase
MHFIREQAVSGEFLAGAWCNLASSMTVEMAANAGFDWILIDQEHGPGDNATLLHQLQAVGDKPSAVIARVVWNQMPLIKRTLDLGASGIMIPYIETAEDAAKAASYMQYPPQGLRGAAMSPRATGYGTRFDQYYAEANQNLLTVVQIETGKAVENAADIAAVDGVDVLFIGPLDLSLSLGMHDRFNDPEFRKVLKQVAQTARGAGKGAGILLPSTGLLEMAHDLGFNFVAAGSDGGAVVQAMNDNRAAMAKLQNP